MDLHPLHRTQNTFASQPSPSPIPPTAVEGVVEPLEYTVKRMAQEIEALRLTAQYNQAKAQKYKMQLTAALAESESPGNEASTATVKALPGFVRSSAPSTNARTCSCKSFRPRDSRCFTASSLNSKLAATVSMD